MFLLRYSKGLAVENGRHYTPSPHRQKSPLYGVTVSVPQSRMCFRLLCSPATFTLPWAKGPNMAPFVCHLQSLAFQAQNRVLKVFWGHIESHGGFRQILKGRTTLLGLQAHFVSVLLP